MKRYVSYRVKGNTYEMRLIIFQSRHRPLIFMGHSLGGLIIKQVMKHSFPVHSVVKLRLADNSFLIGIRLLSLWQTTATTSITMISSKVS